jgi:hypothetical protein
MIVSGIKCDGCDKIHPVDFMRNMSYLDNIPDDWFSLYQGKPKETAWVSHFCSTKCLNTWLSPQIIGDEAVPSDSRIVVHNYVQDEHWKDL